MKFGGFLAPAGRELLFIIPPNRKCLESGKDAGDTAATAEQKAQHFLKLPFAIFPQRDTPCGGFLLRFFYGFSRESGRSICANRGGGSFGGNRSCKTESHSTEVHSAI